MRLQDHGTTGLQANGTAGLQDHGTTGLQDHGTTGLQDHGTTRLQDNGTSGLQFGRNGDHAARAEGQRGEVRGARANDLLPPALSSANGGEGESGSDGERGHRGHQAEDRTPKKNGEQGRGRLRGWMGEAEPWAKAVEGRVLLDKLVALLARFVVLPKWGAETLALWILHTYVFELRDVSTYLGIESPEKRCGKTTLLGVLSKLVNRPVAAANISPPAFFRLIEEVRPTLLIDETDTFLAGSYELRGILNAGYKRETAYVYRVQSPESGVQSRGRDECRVSSVGGAGDFGAAGLGRFSCWCPKVMAAIGRLPETLADRCIVIRMQRKTAKEECERLRNLETTALRRQCARFALDNSDEIAGARPEVPAGLNDRAAEVWEPLLALADLAGGEWPEKARQAALGLTGDAEETSPTGQLLVHIFGTFIEANAERLFSRDLVARLNGFADRPWAETLNGRDITELWLSQRLRPLGIRPRTLRIAEQVLKGYRKEDFMEMFRRYITRAEVDAVREETEVQSPESGRGQVSSVDCRGKGTEPTIPMPALDVPNPAEKTNGTEEA